MKVKLKKSYTPQEFGWEELFPKLKKINIGFCSKPDVGFSIMHAAHTHMLPRDEEADVICIREGYLSYLFDWEDMESPHNLVWHEYGHVLHAQELEDVDCSDTKLMKDIERSMHGPRWQEIMKELGKPELNNPEVTVPWGVEIDRSKYLDE